MFGSVIRAKQNVDPLSSGQDNLNVTSNLFMLFVIFNSMRTDEVKKKRAEYMREYYAKNPEKYQETLERNK